MKTLEFNKKQFILRLEYFGGILINKQNMLKYEISECDALLLLGLARNIPYQQLLSYINEEFAINFCPDISTYCELEVLRLVNNVGVVDDEVKKTIDEIDAVYERVSKINHLVAPIELTIYPSLKCTLNCDFCFLGKNRRTKYIERGASEWLKLIQSFVDAGTASVSVLGGEPSMYSEIIHLLKGLDEMGIRISMTSNGQTWSDKLFETVIESKNITPIFSIESLLSDQQLIDKGKQANVDVTINLIKRLVARGKSCRINTVYTNQSDEEMFDLVDFCVENHIEKFSVAICFGTGKNLPTIRDTNALGDRVRSYIRKKGYDLYFTIEGCMAFSSYTDLDGNIVNSHLQAKQYGCECGNTILEILPDGSLYSCAAFISLGTPIGNAFTEDWEDIWYNSTNLEVFRGSKCTDSLCQKCSCFHFCNGGCPAYKLLSGEKEVYSVADNRCLLHEKIKRER